MKQKETMTDESQAPNGRIDVQFHFSLSFYAEMVKQTGQPTTDRWSIEAALTYIDSNYIAAGIMSVSTPGVNFLPVAESHRKSVTPFNEGMRPSYFQTA